MCSLILSVHWLSFLYSVICLSIGCHFCIVSFVCPLVVIFVAIGGVAVVSEAVLCL